MNIRRAWQPAAVACVASVTLCGCGTSPSSATAPSPGPSTAPTVTLSTDGPASCNPLGRPSPYAFCQVIVKAQARGFDGNVSYAWNGTSAFSPGGGYCSQDGPVAGPTVACTIRSPEQVVVATVSVRDERGHEATASLNVVGEGVNHPPSVILGKPFTLPGGSATLEMFGSIIDPDEPNLCTNDHVVGGSAKGDCRPNIAFWSSCLEGGLTVDIYRTAATGSCELTLQVRDSANLIGTSVITIRY